MNIYVGSKMYGYLLKYFEQAVFAGKPISWQLRRALKDYPEIMPAELCQVLNYRPGPLMPKAR
ncbi:MAG: hypothetical protein PHU23_04600 [Dehalococcoidales bacterium]|nr:hypothetical protein [Dehalococcoidales bacterium]